MNCGRKLSRIRNEIDDALHEEDNSLKECPIHFLLYYKTEMNRALFWFFLILSLTTLEISFTIYQYF